MDNTLNNNLLAEAICSLDKLETITKVLDQTLYEDTNFDIKDSQNLCSVLLREICYTKVKLSKADKSSTEKTPL